MKSLFAALMPTLYVQVSPERVSIRNLKTGTTQVEVAEIAVSGADKPTIEAFGAAARAAQSTSTVRLAKPFAHPRSMVSDFTLGEQLLKALLRKALGRSMFALAPKVVLHLLGDPEGGFTQVEIRAFREMALGAGGAQVVIWQGPPLGDQELLSGKFPQSGKVLS